MSDSKKYNTWIERLPKERKHTSKTNDLLRDIYKVSIGRIPGARSVVLPILLAVGRVVGLMRKKHKFYIKRQGSCGFKAVCTSQNFGGSVDPSAEKNTLRTATIESFAIHIVNDSVVVGGSNMVINNGTLISHDLFDSEYDFTSEELWQLFTSSSNSDFFYLNINYCPKDSLDQAISLLDACSNNYAHWLSEILPKLVMTLGNEKMHGIPILIDDNLNENIIESLLLIAGIQSKIYAVEKNAPITVKNLYMPTVCGYVPFGVKKANPAGEFHGGFNITSLKLLRDIVKQRSSSSIISVGKKLFLGRRSKTRAVVNLGAVELLVSKYGFEIIYPEDYSFAAQVGIFNNATHIIAPTGAALVNGLFCAPGTNVCVLMGEHPEMIYDYWANMLTPLGINVYVLKCLMLNEASGIHGGYIVDTENLSEHIKNWNLHDSRNSNYK